MKQRIAEKFQTLFQTEGDFFASAGRINLIGEHTDYNGGFVFPGAIDKGMIAEIKLNGTEKVRAFALDLDEYCEFGLKEEDAPVQSWARYIFGVCREIQKRGGVVAGFDTVFAGDVPLGAGMSSSAALESTFAFALNELFNLGIEGNGILALESPCPKEELIEINLVNDVLKIDGNMAIAWSGSLEFTVERSGKSLIGSAASGEGLVNVYRGTGKVLLAPVR